jgi:uncharacterized membrane protein
MPSLFHRILILIALLTAVAACSRAAPRKAELPAALRASLGQGGTVNAGGEAPTWTAQVRLGQLHIAVIDTGPELSGAITGFAATDRGVKWNGRTAAGAPLTLAIVLRPCSDGATGMTYPFTATADIEGRSFVGCAAKPGQGLGPRD